MIDQMIDQGIIATGSLLWYVVLVIGSVVVAVLSYYWGISICIRLDILHAAVLLVILIAYFLLGYLGAWVLGIIAIISGFIGISESAEMHARFRDRNL